MNGCGNSNASNQMEPLRTRRPREFLFHCDSDSDNCTNDGSLANRAARISKRIFEDFSAALDANCVTFPYPLADARGSVCRTTPHCLNHNSVPISVSLCSLWFDTIRRTCRFPVCIAAQNSAGSASSTWCGRSFPLESRNVMRAATTSVM